jgi:hypothetical protein
MATLPPANPSQVLNRFYAAGSNQTNGDTLIFKSIEMFRIIILKAMIYNGLQIIRREKETRVYRPERMVVMGGR